MQVDKTVLLVSLVRCCGCRAGGRTCVVSVGGAGGWARESGPLQRAAACEPRPGGASPVSNVVGVGVVVVVVVGVAGAVAAVAVVVGGGGGGAEHCFNREGESAPADSHCRGWLGIHRRRALDGCTW